MTKRRIFLPIIVIGVIALALTGFDEWRKPTLPAWDEIAVDVLDELMIIAAMAGVAWTVQGLRDLHEEQSALSNNLMRAIAQGNVWRSERRAEIAALGGAIQQQFKQWHLSAAEIDIAGLMLKGASLKEIALARDTSEATIRQQAQSIYRKSGLSGRAELSAYFLESLFAEAEDAASRRSEFTVVQANPPI